MSSLPYLIQINEPIQTLHFADQIENIGLHVNEGNDVNTQIFIKSVDNSMEIVQETNEIESEVLTTEDNSCIYQIVYPQELNLAPAYKLIKRGRPKKKKSDEIIKKEIPTLPSKETSKPPKTARTRSGRLVKLPKHIEKDFKKIELTNDEQEIQLTDFKRFEEKENTNKPEFQELHTKKRVISSQYKCPKCQKAYLGKNKMIQHLKKNPDHGPLPISQEQFNFDVWNYLFDITQKCKQGQRGIKFCEELSNLLHNVQLLKSALFKSESDSKNCVHIDKVLGNAIGLAPGKYKFDENELYKDVTVLKLITNSEFFKPNKSSLESVQKQTEFAKVIEDSKIVKKLKHNDSNVDIKKSFSSITDTIEADNTICDKIDDSETNQIQEDSKQNHSSYHSHKTENSLVDNKTIEPPVIENYTKKLDENNHIALHSDLLTENLLLHSLPNTRNSVDELMLSNVDNGSNLLDNSTSSDEVMNVDQFVNERFKKIIEPDIELGNNPLNLDLPSLEFFPFHSS